MDPLTEILYRDECYKIVGLCMEVHRQLGMGFKEIIYKDALQIEFNSNGIPFKKEQNFFIEYKGTVLPHKYFADFVLYEKIILEVKSSPFIVDNCIVQTINYLKASGIRLGLIVNFGERSLTYRRVIF